jgi:hypothetical protein
MNTPLITTHAKASELLKLRNHLLQSDVEQALYQQSLFHIRRTLRQEFGIRFAGHFEQHYPKAFAKLRATTTNRLTWRPPPVEIQLV